MDMQIHASFSPLRPFHLMEHILITVSQALIFWWLLPRTARQIILELQQPTLKVAVVTTLVVA